MTPEQLAAARERLEEFAAEMFAPLSRSDQRVKGETYLRGLLLDGRRKSMQPMGERLGVDHQGLQQFVSSTWAVESVRQRLAARAVEVIEPGAWVVDDTGFVKDGTASPGVTRQYSGTPKTSQQRTVPLPAALADPLAHRYEGQDPDDLLMATPSGTVLRFGTGAEPSSTPPSEQPACPTSPRTTSATPQRRWQWRAERRSRACSGCSGRRRRP